MDTVSDNPSQAAVRPSLVYLLASILFYFPAYEDYSSEESEDEDFADVRLRTVISLIHG